MKDDLYHRRWSAVNMAIVIPLLALVFIATISPYLVNASADCPSAEPAVVVTDEEVARGDEPRSVVISKKGNPLLCNPENWWIILKTTLAESRETIPLASDDGFPIGREDASKIITLAGYEASGRIQWSVSLALIYLTAILSAIVAIAEMVKASVNYGRNGGMWADVQFPLIVGVFVSLVIAEWCSGILFGGVITLDGVRGWGSDRLGPYIYTLNTSWLDYIDKYMMPGIRDLLERATWYVVGAWGLVAVAAGMTLLTPIGDADALIATESARQVRVPAEIDKALVERRVALLTRQMASLKRLMYVASAGLVAGVFHAYALHRWPLAYLRPANAEDNLIGKALYSAIEEFIGQTTIAVGVIFSAAMLVVIVPAALMLNSRARSLARLAEPDKDARTWAAERHLSFSAKPVLDALVVLAPVVAAGAATALQALSGVLE